ncbi:MAG: AsmA family protein [Victivallales bacterium]|nr:AsmA family protein [Victivallales bacterium]
MAKKSGRLLKIIGVVVILLVVLLVAAVMFAGSIIKSSVQEVGSVVTKCDIAIEDVDLSILKGKLTIDNLVVGNPEGFKTDSAFKLGKVHVDLVPMSLFKNRIIINDIQVIAPEITYEVAPVKLTSNIGTIQKNVESFLPSSDDKDDKDEKKDSKPGKKIQINHVIVSDGKINVSATFAGGNAIPIPLPKIEMNDIGKEKDVSGIEASAEILDKTLGGVVAAASDSVKSIGSSVGEGIKDGIKGLIGGSKDKAEKAGKDAEKSAKDMIDAAKDKAEKAGKDAEKSVNDGIKDILGAVKDKAEKAAEKK